MLNLAEPSGSPRRRQATPDGVPVAALARGQPVRARYLIGNTPSDIDAARSADARSIAVATGKFSEEELRAAGADHVFPDLGDTAQLLL